MVTTFIAAAPMRREPLLRHWSVGEARIDWVHLLIIPGGSQCTELPLVTGMTGMASALQEPAPVITKRSLLGAQSNVDYCQGDVSSNIITWHCTHWEISQYLINLC